MTNMTLSTENNSRTVNHLLSKGYAQLPGAGAEEIPSAFGVIANDKRKEFWLVDQHNYGRTFNHIKN